MPFPEVRTRRRSDPEKAKRKKPSHRRTLNVCRGTPCPSRQALSPDALPKRLLLMPRPGEEALTSGRAGSSGHPHLDVGASEPRAGAERTGEVRPVESMRY